MAELEYDRELSHNSPVSRREGTLNCDRIASFRYMREERILKW